jgi:hypothetical protein
MVTFIYLLKATVCFTKAKGVVTLISSVLGYEQKLIPYAIFTPRLIKPAIICLRQVSLSLCLYLCMVDVTISV